MPGTFGDNFFCERITSLCVAQSNGSQARILRRGRPFCPRDQRKCIGPKPSHHFEQKGSRSSPAVVCAKGEPHGLQSEIGTAALIGDWKSVSSDTELAAFHPSEADAAGAQNDNASIAATMRSQASHVRVSRVDDVSKRMWEAQKRFTGPFTINSSQSHAGARVCKGGRQQTGGACRRHARCAHRLHRSIRADTRCGRPRGTLTQNTTLRIFDAGSATSSTAIDTNIKLSVIRWIVFAHPLTRLKW